MKIVVVDGVTGARHAATVPFAGADHCAIDRCPRCDVAPCKVGGTGITHHNHDTYFAGAVALCCRERIGTIETTVDTLFGIDEDNAVLHGRPRVY